MSLAWNNSLVLAARPLNRMNSWTQWPVNANYEWHYGVIINSGKAGCQISHNPQIIADFLWTGSSETNFNDI